MEITLNSGVKLTVNKPELDDMELIDMLAEADDGNPLAASRVVSRIIDPEQKKILYDSLRNEDGRVPTTAFYHALSEIMEKLGQDGKN